MKSIAQMLETIYGLTGTKDVSEWEDGFITNVHGVYLLNKKNTSCLTAKQVEVVERIFNKHFA